jgi:hypothetical protein
MSLTVRRAIARSIMVVLPCALLLVASPASAETFLTVGVAPQATWPAPPPNTGVFTTVNATPVSPDNGKNGWFRKPVTILPSAIVDPPGVLFGLQKFDVYYAVGKAFPDGAPAPVPFFHQTWLFGFGPNSFVGPTIMIGGDGPVRQEANLLSLPDGEYVFGFVAEADLTPGGHKHLGLHFLVDTKKPDFAKSRGGGSDSRTWTDSLSGMGAISKSGEINVEKTDMTPAALSCNPAGLPATHATAKIVATRKKPHRGQFRYSATGEDCAGNQVPSGPN